MPPPRPAFPSRGSESDMAPPPRPSGASKIPPPISSRVDAESRTSHWYFTTDNADRAQHCLAGRSDGAFSVCERFGDDSSLDLLYIIKGNETSYRIVSAPRGLHLVGMSQYFQTLHELISFCESDASCLGVTLSTALNMAPPRPAKLPTRSDFSSAPAPVDTEDHVGQPWYLEDMAKERALEMIEFEPQGAFIVRDSSTEPGCYALSYSFGGRVQHKIIETTSSGLRFRAGESLFPNLSQLIAFYMRSPSADLKCLLMPSRDPNVVQLNRTKRVAAQAAEAQRAATLSRTSTFSNPGAPAAKPSWDCRTMTREKAMEKLNSAPMGAFVIRPSDKSFAALSMVSPSGLYHMHIEQDSRGIFFRKCTEVFADLGALVEFYCTSRQSDLPVPLTVTR